jgi:hypothetical protein
MSFGNAAGRWRRADTALAQYLTARVCHRRKCLAEMVLENHGALSGVGQCRPAVDVWGGCGFGRYGTNHQQIDEH